MRANLPKGLGGGQQNMQGMIRQAQKLQEQMGELEESFATREFETQAGGGTVTIRMNGKKEVLSLAISPEIVDPADIETLSDVLIAAFNEVHRQVEDAHEKEMSAITGNSGLSSIPGLF